MKEEKGMKIESHRVNSQKAPAVKPKSCMCRVEGNFAFISPSCPLHEDIVWHTYPRSQTPATGGHAPRNQSYLIEGRS